MGLVPAARQGEPGEHIIVLLRSFRSVKLGGLGLLVECVAQLLRLQASSAVARAAPRI